MHYDQIKVISSVKTQLIIIRYSADIVLALIKVNLKTHFSFLSLLLLTPCLSKQAEAQHIPKSFRCKQKKVYKAEMLGTFEGTGSFFNPKWSLGKSQRRQLKTTQESIGGLCPLSRASRVMCEFIWII